MDRNSNNHFAHVPQVEMQRSRFEINHTHKTTFNAGDIIPIFWDEILPGDSVTMDLGAAMRMSTPIFPVMDNAYVDFYAFFEPNRLLWKHWKEFLGENNTTAWEQETEYAIPHLKAPTNGWTKGTIADYMGVPTKVGGITANALPFRMYVDVWNNWFRDQNLKQPALMNTDDADQQGENFPTQVTDASYVTNAQLGGAPLKAAKFHDLFTAALPSPQKGPDVLIPLGGVSGTLPVTTVAGMNNAWNGEPLRMAYNRSFAANDNRGRLMIAINNTSASDELKGAVATNTDQGFTAANDSLMSPANLGVVTGTNIQDNSTINQLRMAFAMQRFYERQARGGTRYREILKNMFAVTTSDATMQIPEYLGGFRKHINIDQVLQTSATTETSPQGNAAAFSLTSFADNLFTKSFEEHGILMVVAVVRHDNTYQQGLNKKFQRRDKFSYFWPSLSNIGEQPLKVSEIYATGTAADNETFGFQEAWAEYRYHPNMVTGAFRSNYEQSLDNWHYADYYTEQPILSSQWIDATKNSIDRTLAVQSSVEDQFIADFEFRAFYTRPMPIYSVPGLIDHY